MELAAVFEASITSQSQQGEVVLVVVIFQVEMPRKARTREIVFIPAASRELGRHQILHPPIDAVPVEVLGGTTRRQ